MKILIIDDEMTILRKMETLLAPYGECVLATSADQALQLCAAAAKLGTPFGLMTIDIHLEQANGLDLLAAINKLENDRDLPAARKIMVTASGTKDNIMKAVVKGCDGFIVKPVKRDTLEQKMSGLGFVKKPAPTPADLPASIADSTKDQASPQ
jgi:two-component system chemotaxis response regulator CheY